MPRSAALLFFVLGAAGCASRQSDPGYASSETLRYSMTGVPGNDATVAAGQPAPLDPARSITERDCSKPIDMGGGNLRCR